MVEEYGEKFILAFILFVIMLLVSIQTIVLRYGNKFNEKYFLENQGAVLEKIEYLYDYGFINLELHGRNQEPGLHVLRNGVKIGEFIEKTMCFEVISGDIIELDATGTTGVITVEATYSNSVMSDPTETVTVKMRGDVKSLFRAY